MTAEQLAGPLLGVVDEASVLVPLLQQPGSTHHHVNRDTGRDGDYASKQFTAGFTKQARIKFNIF